MKSTVVSHISLFQGNLRGMYRGGIEKYWLQVLSRVVEGQVHADIKLRFILACISPF